MSTLLCENESHLAPGLLVTLLAGWSLPTCRWNSEDQLVQEYTAQHTWDGPLVWTGSLVNDTTNGCLEALGSCALHSMANRGAVHDGSTTEWVKSAAET